MALTDITIYRVEDLRQFVAHVFMHFGVSETDSVQAADVLVCADLRGIDSHGVARLHTYFDMLSQERINPRPQIRVIRCGDLSVVINNFKEDRRRSRTAFYEAMTNG
jgi:LDH2 family malate/lactate/ureidoglycolate dehydrogenase